MHEGKLLFCDTPAVLKERLRGAVLAVHSPEPRAVRDRLQGAPGISSLVMTGDGVHLVVDDAAKRTPEFRALLTASNTAFESIEPVAASIEDLFVHAVTGGQAA